jgi:hypothetical protein
MYRNYSISSKEDLININNGRCPDYALEWDKESNEQHWSEGHDYIIGFNMVDEEPDKKNASTPLKKVDNNFTPLISPPYGKPLEKVASEAEEPNTFALSSLPKVEPFLTSPYGKKVDDEVG